MPLLGAHMSIAGGYHNAADRRAEHGCDTVQLFTKNNNQWARQAAHATRTSRLFRRSWPRPKLQLPMAHDSYLINLASPDETLYRRSVDAFVEEIERAEALGLTYLVTHPGTPTDGDEEAGLQRVVAALDEVHRRCPKFGVMVLLETTAGQGSSLGHRFEHLAAHPGRRQAARAARRLPRHLPRLRRRLSACAGSATTRRPSRSSTASSA